VIRTATGVPISSNRAALLTIRATTNASLPPALWPPLSLPLVLTNGVLGATHVSEPVSQQFFIVSEPQ
jgi:hypothetical protein